MLVENAAEGEVEGVAEAEGPDEDFDAGFEGGTEPTPTPEPDTEEPAPVIEAPVAAEPVPEAPKFAQITEAQLREILDGKAESKRLLDTAFGQLGGMKQRIEQMQAATPAGAPVVLTLDDFAEMREDYPDFTEKQLPVLNRMLAKLKGTGPTMDPAVIERMVSERVASESAAVTERIVNSALSVSFPGWQKEVKTDQFKQWTTAQPADVQALIRSSDVGDAALMLKMYEAHKSKPVPTPPPKNSTRQQVINAAVAPKGTGGHAPAPSEDDEFNAGFNGA